jgi:hypothetical protein
MLLQLQPNQLPDQYMLLALLERMVCLELKLVVKRE